MMVTSVGLIDGCTDRLNKKPDLIIKNTKKLYQKIKFK